MEKYQSIHNFLLRLSRVDTVTRSLYWDIVHQSESATEPIKVGVDSGLNRLPKGHRQQPRRMKAVLMSGSTVEHRLHRLRFRMSHFVTALSRYVLDTAIGANWDTMRRRLERLKRRDPARGENRPPTPSAEMGEDFDFQPMNEVEDDNEEDDHTNIGQLQSVHSLVLYHHLTLDRIMRACLLSSHAGHQMTFKVLMALFGLVLDLGKLVKEVERGVMGFEEGEGRVKALAAEWEEKEAIFVSDRHQQSVQAYTDSWIATRARAALPANAQATESLDRDDAGDCDRA